MKTSLQEEIILSQILSEKEFSPQKKKNPFWKIFFASILALCFFGLGALCGFLFDTEEPCETQTEEKQTEVDYGVPSWVTPAIIRVDGESRRGEKLEGVSDIAVHYVGNPGSSAMGNRNYFDGPDSTTSSHFIVGLDGEVLLCVPLDEKSSATNHRNRDTISVEVCHPDETGEFSFKTRESLIKLLAFLCEKYDLTEENLIRHYDVTGKLCPLYYVENPEAWEEIKQDVGSLLRKN